MIIFAAMRWTVGEFRAVLENKLKNFHEGSDYYTYQEASGRVRKKNYVICSERPVKTLQEVNWKKLEGFKKIRVGEEVGSGISNEPMKFVVETLTNEWVPYQTDKPNFQGSASSSPVVPKGQEEMLERQREMNQRKAEMEKRKNEFIGGSPQYSSAYNVRKYCSNCKIDEEILSSSNFCQYCGQTLTNLSRFEKIDDKKFIKESQDNNRKDGGDGSSSGLLGGLGFFINILLFLGLSV